jgi:hypothetical protein
MSLVPRDLCKCSQNLETNCEPLSEINSNYNSNQPSLKDLVLGQAKINKNLTKKLLNNDKMLENINTKIEGLSSSIKNQLTWTSRQ